MRVVHVIAPAPFGGAESVVRALAVGRRERGGTSVAALLAGEDHPFVRDLRAAGVPVQSIMTSPRAYLRQAGLLAEHIREIRADLIHTHVYHADFVGYLAARRAHRRVVSTVHGYISGSGRNRFYEWADRRLLRKFDAVVCVSKRNRDRLLAAGCASARLHVVPNGFAPGDVLSREEARRQLGLSADARVIGWVGRISDEKGPDLLLDAVATLARPDVVTILVGEGPARSSVESRVAADPALRNVRVAGSLSAVARLLAAFDVLAISSRTEGLPMVMLEAIHAGTPVVAFGVGGVPEQLSPDTAWLVPPLDTSALARCLAEALDAPDERRRRAEAARRTLDGPLGLANWISGVEKVYHAVVPPAGEPPLLYRALATD